jgi:glycosyltransferase involved in cell wall biosynthesis
MRSLCRYNTRWERWRAVQNGRIRVIYNGVDPVRFSPASEPRPPSTRPLVVNVGLIFPLKGQLDSIEAAVLVRRDIPDVEVQLYGSPAMPSTTRSAEPGFESSAWKTPCCSPVLRRRRGTSTGRPTWLPWPASRKRSLTA